jgi:NF-kappa-B inhibitor-interacting Ras-like protein
MGRTQRVVVCGARGAGKTSVLEKLIYGNNGVGAVLCCAVMCSVLCCLLFPALQPFSSTLEDVYVANIETDRGTKEKIRSAFPVHSQNRLCTSYDVHNRF